MMRVPGTAMAGLAALAFVWPAWAATYYVTPSGNGGATGADWANAYSAAQLQTAVDACSTAGDEIYLRHGVYSNSAQISAVSRPDLTIRGGYEGVGSPGGFTNDATVLTRVLSVTNRIFYGNTSTLTLDRLTITNGIATNSVFGAGLYLTNCTATVTNCIIADNRIPGSGGLYRGGGIYAIGGILRVFGSLLRNNGYTQGGVSTSRHGGGIYALNVDVTLADVTLAGNRVGANDAQAGAGLYLNGGSALISRCTFNTNYIGEGWTGYGGAIYATAVSALTITNCTFRGNSSSGTAVYYAYGGALYISGSASLNIADCVFEGNYTAGNTGASYINNRGGQIMYLEGTVVGTISGCEMAGSQYGNGPVNDLDINLTSPNRVAIRNTVMRGALRDAIRKRGTSALSLTNCLIYAYVGNGVKAEAGTVLLSNCTVADNTGWGLTNAAATVSVINSVVWGNAAGGVRTNAADTVNYTCSQEPHPGAGNRNEDPLFVGGYYLSVNGLPTQDADSPCIDAGSDTAAALGLNTRTTRTDGNNDTAGAVDLGYHATNGFSLANLVMYVNANSPGDNANDGLSPATAFKTITKALSGAIIGSTIHIAAGRYDQALGESFPLVSQELNLTLKGTNRASTVIDAGATSRVFSADGGGNIWLEGLTLTNGSAQTGAGLYLPVCQTTITNCTITGNRLPGPNATYKGGGIYAFGGTLTVVDSLVRNNGYSVGYAAGPRYGGGICAETVAVTLNRVTLGFNFVESTGPAGGGVHLSGGSAMIADCGFYSNYVNVGWSPCGGAIYATGVNPLTITNCAFVGNSISGGSVYYGYGAALYVVGGGLFSISDCRFERNALSGNGGSYNQRGSAIYLSGVAGSISEGTIEGHTAGIAYETLYVETTSPNNVAIQGVAMKGVVADGVYKKGTGGLAMTNCLIYAFSGDGVQADAGTVTLVNSTLANNGGWGISNATGVVTARNCIAWGNTNGGFTGSGNAISYTCSQEALSGEGNLDMNPLFAGAATNNFQLLRSSPCINAGANEPWMVAATDLDGNRRIRSGRVDMGAYEAKAGFGAVFVIR